MPLKSSLLAVLILLPGVSEAGAILDPASLHFATVIRSSNIVRCLSDIEKDHGFDPQYTQVEFSKVEITSIERPAESTTTFRVKLYFPDDGKTQWIKITESIFRDRADRYRTIFCDKL
jgi:hypothetical protein